MTDLVTTDPMEMLVEAALQRAGIKYAPDIGGGNDKALDFYLPDLDLYIEVKRFHSPRIAEQMERAENVIAIQGKAAVLAFCEMIAPNPARSVHRKIPSFPSASQDRERI